MTDIEKVKGWVRSFISLQRIQAETIEKVHGKGWVSDVKLECANEAEKWLESNPTDFDNPIETKLCSTPDNFKISDVFPNGIYSEYKFADGTIRRVCTIEPQ